MSTVQVGAPAGSEAAGASAVTQGGILGSTEIVSLQPPRQPVAPVQLDPQLRDGCNVTPPRDPEGGPSTSRASDLTQRLRVARALRDASGNAYVRYQSSIQDVHVEVAEMTLGDALDLREAEANRVARSLADLESRLSELREHRL
jgi:hypothetical protein